MIEKLGPGNLHGHLLRTSRVADFVMSEAKYDAESYLPRHIHENHYFCFVLYGSYTERYGKREVTCGPSAVTFRAPNDIHEDYIHAGGSGIFVLEISPLWIERLKADSLDLDSTQEFCGGASTRLCARLSREFRKSDTAAKLAMEGLALELLAETARRRSTQIRAVPQWLKHAREIIVEHFPGTLSLTQIASEVGVHPVYLSTAFRQKFGVTIGEFVRRLRIERACAELKKGDLSLAAIATQAGYVDQSHFSRDFKLHVGTTPNNYRKNS